MNKVDLIILKQLLKENKINFIKSLSMYDLDITKALNISTISKRIKYLEKMGFIKKGIKESKKNTYFITNLGITELQKIEKN